MRLKTFKNNIEPPRLISHYTRLGMFSTAKSAVASGLLVLSCRRRAGKTFAFGSRTCISSYLPRKSRIKSATCTKEELSRKPELPLPIGALPRTLYFNLKLKSFYFWAKFKDRLSLICSYMKVIPRFTLSAHFIGPVVSYLRECT